MGWGARAAAAVVGVNRTLLKWVMVYWKRGGGGGVLTIFKYKFCRKEEKKYLVSSLMPHTSWFPFF